MNKPVYGMLLGGVLGAFDGMTALVSAPETAPQILQIVAGSTFKGLVAGVLIGWFANKVHSTAKGVAFGLVIGLLFAYLVAMNPNPDGSHYYWEIMIPGSIVGMIVGYATQRYRGSSMPARA